MVNKKQLEKKERNRKDREWRKKVVENYNGQCVICSDKNRPNAHHIIPKTFEATRWDVENGVLLCPKHHKFGKFSAHKNGLWFISWLEKCDPHRYAYLVKINEYGN